MSAPDASEMSKSARKRANQKARAEAEAPEAAPPAPAPKAVAKADAKAKAKGKAAPAPAPEPKAEAKAKAKGKAKAAAPEPEPAPKAKAKAKGKAAPAPEPVAEAKPKGEAKAKAKGKAKAKEVVEAKPVVQESVVPMELDDGTGGDWAVASAVSKKSQKRLDKQAVEQAQEENVRAAVKAAGGGQAAGGKHIPGLVTTDAALGQAKGKAGAGIVVKAVSAYSATVPAAVAAKAAEEKPVEVSDGSVTGQVKIDPAKIGRVIGPKGANITLIKEKTGVKTIDTAGDLCSIVGQPSEVALAIAAITELMEKGYMSLAFEDFQEDGVQCHPSCFPDLIGKGGAVIQAIKKEAKVEIDIPKVPPNSPASKKFKVSIAGSKQGVAQAIEIINSIIMFAHHEVTHPGFTHEEMEVEEWKYRFLIGKGGSEMRHVQNNFKVKVNIPRETSATDKVVVIGEPADVTRAVKYMEKVLFEAEQVKADPRADKAEDTWGAEEPEEAWMSPYMYKRR